MAKRKAEEEAAARASAEADARAERDARVSREQQDRTAQAQSSNDPNDIHSAQFYARLDRFMRLTLDGQRDVVVKLGQAAATDPWAVAKLSELKELGPDQVIQVGILMVLKDATPTSREARDFLFRTLEQSSDTLGHLAAIKSLEPAATYEDTYSRLGEYLLRSQDESLRLEAIRVLSTHIEVEFIRRVLGRELAGSSNEKVSEAVSQVFVKNASRFEVRESLIKTLMGSRREASIERLLTVLVQLRNYDEVETALYEKYERTTDTAIRRLITRVLSQPRAAKAMSAVRRGDKCEQVISGLGTH
jgi:hypothetical protein